MHALAKEVYLSIEILIIQVEDSAQSKLQVLLDAQVEALYIGSDFGSDSE
jgi:hypothetical protein